MQVTVIAARRGPLAATEALELTTFAQVCQANGLEPTIWLVSGLDMPEVVRAIVDALRRS